MPRKLRLLTGQRPFNPLAADAGLLHCFLDSRLRSAALPRLVTDLIVLPAGQARPVVLASAATCFLPSRCPLFGRNAWQRHQVPSLLGLGCGAAGFPIFAVARN